MSGRPSAFVSFFERYAWQSVVAIFALGSVAMLGVAVLSDVFSKPKRAAYLDDPQAAAAAEIKPVARSVAKPVVAAPASAAQPAAFNAWDAKIRCESLTTVEFFEKFFRDHYQTPWDPTVETKDGVTTHTATYAGGVVSLKSIDGHVYLIRFVFPVAADGYATTNAKHIGGRVLASVLPDYQGSRDETLQELFSRFVAMASQLSLVRDALQPERDGPRYWVHLDCYATGAARFRSDGANGEMEIAADHFGALPDRAK